MLLGLIRSHKERIEMYNKEKNRANKGSDLARRTARFCTKRLLSFTLIFLAILLLLFFQINVKFGQGYHNPVPILSGSNLSLVFYEDHILGFQGEFTKALLEIKVKDGLLNGTSASLVLFNDRGHLKFESLNDCTLEIFSPDLPENPESKDEFTVAVYGSAYNSIGAFKWQAIIKAGDSVTIQWSYRLESWIDKYTMLGIGVGGVILTVVPPIWGALTIRKKGINANSIETLGYVFLSCLIGICLVIMWLWS